MEEQKELKCWDWKKLVAKNRRGSIGNLDDNSHGADAGAEKDKEVSHVKCGGYPIMAMATNTLHDRAVIGGDAALNVSQKMSMVLIRREINQISECGPKHRTARTLCRCCERVYWFGLDCSRVGKFGKTKAPKFVASVVLRTDGSCLAGTSSGQILVFKGNQIVQVISTAHSTVRARGRTDSYGAPKNSVGVTDITCDDSLGVVVSVGAGGELIVWDSKLSKSCKPIVVTDMHAGSEPLALGAVRVDAEVCSCL